MSAVTEKQVENIIEAKLKAHTNKIYKEVEAITTSAKTAEKYWKMVEATMAGVEIGAANESLNHFADRLRSLREVAQIHILKAAVFFGMYSLAKQQGLVEPVVAWFFRNEAARFEEWDRRKEWTLQQWLDMVTSGCELMRDHKIPDAEHAEDEAALADFVD